MDYQFNEDQAALVSAVQAILADHSEIPQSARLSYSYYDADLQRQLVAGGFLDAGRVLGALEAALVVIECARSPKVVETGASALVLPQVLGDEPLEGAVALISLGDLAKAHRNLPIARTALVDLGEEVAIVSVHPGDVEEVDSILAYPYGKFRTLPNLETCRRIKGGSKMRQWWRVALACECAGAAQSAVAFTVDYVKERHAFGKPIGAFQAVQHRLAQCHQIALGIYHLALRAAWSKSAQDADLAACYAQQNIQKLVFDLHQFNGAMGVTNEHLLHFWTYRLRALQGEVGGLYDAALAISGHVFGAVDDQDQHPTVGKDFAIED